MRTIHTTVFSGLAQRTAESVSDLASVVRNLIRDVRDCYRPGLHSMRGPRPAMARQMLRQRRIRSDQ
jgi:hypothetical protein